MSTSPSWKGVQVPQQFTHFRPPREMALDRKNLDSRSDSANLWMVEKNSIHAVVIGFTRVWTCFVVAFVLRAIMRAKKVPHQANRIITIFSTQLLFISLSMYPTSRPSLQRTMIKTPDGPWWALKNIHGQRLLLFHEDVLYHLYV